MLFSNTSEKNDYIFNQLYFETQKVNPSKFMNLVWTIYKVGCSWLFVLFAVEERGALCSSGKMS